MDEIKNLQKEIETIKVRNKKVEADKAWETSWERKIIVLILTYLVVVIFMTAAKFSNPLVEAIVPTAAYLVSMGSMPYFKKWWLKRNK